jgi:hypothetical protein
MELRSTLLCALVMPAFCAAQSVAPTGFVSAGGHATGANVQLGWSLGQVVGASFSGSGHLTAGVQQPDGSGLPIQLRVLLEGPWRSAAGLMVDSLRALSLLPLNEPYTSMGFTVNGPTTTSQEVFNVSGADAVTDWVLVELRSSNDPAEVLETRAGLVQRDGDVVGVDGVSALCFNRASGDYHVAVLHRNHLGAMAAQPVRVGFQPAVVDLSSAGTTTYGTDARKAANGRMFLWAGNVAFDDQLKYTGGNNDRDPILSAIGGVVPTSTVSGYRLEDVNLDGVVKYSGSNNDRDPILSNIGGVVPTNVLQEQLP